MEERERDVLSSEELLVYLDGFRNEVEERLQTVTEKVSLLQELFVKRVKDDEVRKKAFDELHGELQAYKRNFLAEAQKPLLKSLLLLYDTIERREQAGADVAVVREELLEILHRNGVELVREVPAKYDREVQMAVDTEPADQQGKDLDVVRVVRQGFRLGDQMLRPQEVVIRKFVP